MNLIVSEKFSYSLSLNGRQISTVISYFTNKNDDVTVKFVFNKLTSKIGVLKI